MHPRPFEYHRPTTVAEAVSLLEKHGDRAKILAGGQSLIPVMKLRLASPEVLVDIGRIRGLEGIKEDRDGLRIGALTRDAEIETSKLIQSKYSLLADAAGGIGDPEVRNQGTIGGSVAHADPAGDWGAALLALEATIIAKGRQGARKIPIDAFFAGAFATALKPAEVLTEIRFPKAAPRSGGAYIKLKRRTGDFATVAAGAYVRLDAKGNVTSVRIGLAAVGLTSLRAKQAEASLMGKQPTASEINAAARLASQECEPASDLRGSEAYKRAMVEVFVRKALERAIGRARR